MKQPEIKTTGYTGIANISAISAVVFLGAVSIFNTIIKTELVAPAIPMVVCTIAAILLLISFFRSIKNPNILAFFTPNILFVFFIILMAMAGWNFPHFFLICLCFCSISCLYANFYMSLWSAIIQSLIIGIIVLTGIPVIGSDVSLGITLTAWITSLFGIFVLLLIAKTATLTLNRASADQNSFRTFLTTTANYVSMVDESNRVIHTTKPMAQLAQIENADLAKGRPLIDLFPGRELKMLVYKMLQQRGSYEDDWVFTLRGQKRYFKAFSTGLTGSSPGTLISLHDMTHLAERDEIALMRDSLKIGLFFMDKNYIIQDQYSRFLEQMLAEQGLFGQCFLDILRASFNQKEIDSVKDYFDMVFEGSIDNDMLKEINPLNELYYVCSKTNEKKVFHCEFTTIERSHGEVYALVTIYDITAKIELQQRLLEEENRRQEEMKSIFELIQVDAGVFSDFLADAEYEFGIIDETLKSKDMSHHDILVDVYQSIHAIKANAVILGLSTFGNKVHALESKIKKLREQEEEVSFDDMLNLTMDIEKISREKDGFKTILDKIHSFKTTKKDGQNQSEYVLVESLTKTSEKSSDDMGKKVKFVVDGIDPDILETGPRRIMKEALMQFVRNSVVHGIESPEERLALGKNETGNIHLSIKYEGENIHVKLGDDGKGLDFDKISEKAVSLNMIGPDDRGNKNALLKAIFLPGFSTAETEGVHAGRGIGLNLVLDRVREAQGFIRVQTEKGHGTVFNIYFPREPKDKAPEENMAPVLVDWQEVYL